MSDSHDFPRLTYLQWKILVIIKTYDKASQHEIHGMLSYSKYYYKEVYRAIKRLRKLGLITQSKDDSYTKKIVCSSTEEGDKLT